MPVDQPNKLAWGGARHGGNRAVAVASLRSRWVRIFSITRVFDAGDDLDVAVASLTGLDVDVEYPRNRKQPLNDLCLL